MSQTTSYAYDLHGNVVLKTMPNGETVAQTFDALNRVETIEGQRPSAGGLLYRYTQRYALSGDVVHIREDYQTSPAKWREITQSYDGAHRLVEEEFRYSEGGILGSAAGDRDVVYTYDDADNRTAKETHYLFPDREDYTYNNLNQLTQLIVSQAERPAQTASSREVDYAYDLNGNRISREDTAGTAGYAYDYENRLVEVTEPSSAPVYGYIYDYRTRRVAIATTPTGGPATTTTLSFSGEVSVQEYVDSTLSVEFIRGSDMGGGIGGLLYSLRDESASFTHYNNRGDVVAKTDTGSTLTFRAAYEAYGKRSEETGSTLDPQKANTKDEDPTGLLNEGFRYRDLEAGLFITRDPLGAAMLQPSDSWIVDGDEVSASEYNRVRYGVGGGNAKPLDTAKDVHEKGAHQTRGAQETSRADHTAFEHFVSQRGQNLYCYVSQNPWTKADPEGLEGLIIIHRDSGRNSPGTMYMFENGRFVGSTRVNENGYMGPAQGLKTQTHGVPASPTGVEYKILPKPKPDANGRGFPVGTPSVTAPQYADPKSPDYAPGRAAPDYVKEGTVRVHGKLSPGNPDSTGCWTTDPAHVQQVTDIMNRNLKHGGTTGRVYTTENLVDAKGKKIEIRQPQPVPR